MHVGGAVDQRAVEIENHQRGLHENGSPEEGGTVLGTMTAAGTNSMVIQCRTATCKAP